MQKLLHLFPQKKNMKTYETLFTETAGAHAGDGSRQVAIASSTAFSACLIASRAAAWHALCIQQER